jgi:hypothetical protein
MRSWRSAVVALLLGLWVAASVAWGWQAAIVFGFFLGLAVVLTVGLGIGGALLTRSGARYYDHLLDGRRRR